MYNLNIILYIYYFIIHRNPPNLQTWGEKNKKGKEGSIICDEESAR